MKLTALKLRKSAKDIIKESRTNPDHIYTQQEIQESKHPDKVCELCGQKGCDVFYADKYLHKKCYRKLKKLSEKLNK